MVSRRPFVLVLLMCSASVVVGQDKPPEPPAPKDIDKATLAALEKHKLLPAGYMGTTSQGLTVVNKEDVREYRVPAFELELGAYDAFGRPYGRFIGSPHIGVPFGLWVTRRTPGADSSELEHLVRQTRLTHLRLSRDFTNADLEVVAELKSLTHLDLSGTKVTGAGLKHIVKLNSLVYLDLRGTRVAGSWLKCLDGMKNLTVLRLDSKLVVDQDLEHVAALKGLTSLTLRSNSVVDHEDLGSILGYTQHRLTAVGLKHLVAMPKLNTLDVQVILSDGDVKVLTEFKGLTSLSVSLSGSVTDAGLRSLTAVKSLTHLSLWSPTKVTAEGVAEFKKAVPNCKVHWVGKD